MFTSRLGLLARSPDSLHGDLYLGRCQRSKHAAKTLCAIGKVGRSKRRADSGLSVPRPRRPHPSGRVGSARGAWSCRTAPPAPDKKRDESHGFLYNDIDIQMTRCVRLRGRAAPPAPTHSMVQVRARSESETQSNTQHTTPVRGKLGGGAPGTYARHRLNCSIAHARERTGCKRRRMKRKQNERRRETDEA